MYTNVKQQEDNNKLYVYRHLHLHTVHLTVYIFTIFFLIIVRIQILCPVFSRHSFLIRVNSKFTKSYICKNGFSEPRKICVFITAYFLVINVQSDFTLFVTSCKRYEVNRLIFVTKLQVNIYVVILLLFIIKYF
jgi:hypothetical protein